MLKVGSYEALAPIMAELLATTFRLSQNSLLQAHTLLVHLCIIEISKYRY